ncbi:MAG: S41 family peptidase [bacterium]|nr:S41 family peptidase [bacterium]
MQRLPRNGANIILSVLLIAGVFYIGFRMGENHVPESEKISTLSGKDAPLQVVETVDFSPFWTVWNVLDERFVSATTTQISEQDKVWGAIEGLASSFKDPYTVFLPPEEARMFESEISGNFEGVGMEIGIKDAVLTVVAPLKGTPAERAGIRPGDKILKINDEVSTNMKVEEAVKIIRGKRGTEVRLTIYREGKREPFEVKVVRDVIDIPTIDTEVHSGTAQAGSEPEEAGGLRPDGIFVIKLYNFSATAPRLFRDALRTFVESGSHKLIIDLRGNPGGFLEASVDIASWFLPAGKVVVTEDYGKGKQERIHRSRGYDVFNKNLKLIVLVNNGSASASEILAGALQAHKKATIVGSTTYGKGSVQELVKITPDTSLKVTVARWLTPDGTSISEGGLKPDVEVKMTAEDAEKKRDPQMDRAIELLNR